RTPPDSSSFSLRCLLILTCAGTAVLADADSLIRLAEVLPFGARHDRVTIAPLGMAITEDDVRALLVAGDVPAEPPRFPWFGIVRGSAAAGRGLVVDVRVGGCAQVVYPP